MVSRKAELRRLVLGTNIFFSEGFEVDGAAFLKQACEMNFEGVVSKRRNSRYRSGRTNDWVKVTCQQRETLVVIGYGMKESRFDGLYVARIESDRLVSAGKGDNGFTRDSIADLRNRLDPLAQIVPTIKIKKPNTIWVRPELLIEVEYRAKSIEGKVRHAFFKGVRDDLS